MYEMFEAMLGVIKQYGAVKSIDLHEKGTYRKEGFEIEGVLNDGKCFSVRFENEDDKEKA